MLSGHKLKVHGKISSQELLFPRKYPGKWGVTNLIFKHPTDFLLQFVHKYPDYSLFFSSYLVTGGNKPKEMLMKYVFCFYSVPNILNSELKAIDKSDTNYLIMEILSLASSSQHRLQRFDLMLSTRYHFYKT